MAGNRKLNSVFCPGIRFKRLAVTLALGLGMMPFSGQAAPDANAVSLSLMGLAAPDPVFAGDQFAYSITVSNTGVNPATSVVVSDQLPGGMNFISAYPSQGSFATNGNIVSCNFGDIDAGGVATVLIYASSSNSGTFNNPVSVSADQTNLDAGAAAISIPVSVAVPGGPVITQQPGNQLLGLGSLLNLVISVLTGPNAHYQWRLNGANIPGATNASYLVTSLLATDGGSYTVVVADDNGLITSEPILVTLAGLLSLPASDNFEGRKGLSILGTTTGNNIGATLEPGEPVIAGVPGGSSVWFKWTPLLSGVATLSTAGSSFDTLLGVYTGNSLTNLTLVASDDDHGGYYTSEVKFNAKAGTTYSIVVDGAYGAQGQIVLTSSEALLTPAIPQITAQPTDQIVGFGGTAQFSVQATGSELSYQWYRNGQTVAGATAASVTVTNVSTNNIGLYYATVTSSGGSVLSMSANLEITVTDGNANPNLSAMDKFQAAFLAASGGSENNAVKQSVTRYVTTKSSTRKVVSKDTTTSRGYSSTQVFTTYASQTQSGEPNNCSNPGGASSWTSITAPADGLMVINTYGSSFRTILGAYTGSGTDFSTLKDVACGIGTGTGGTSNAAVSFAATSNTTYYISVDGYNGAYGNVVLNSSLNVAPAITSQPASQTASPGATVTLTAGVTGHATPGCQWWFNGSPVHGCTNSTLTITNFQSSKVGAYQLMATNSMGWVATTNASLLLNSSLHLDSCGMTCSNGQFQLRVVGVANTNYTLLSSTDMLHWLPIATNKSSTGLWTFTDGQSTNYTRRFYRVVAGP